MPTRRRTQRSRILALLDQFEPAIARAFREAIGGIRGDAILAEVEAAVATGSADAVMRALRLDRAAFMSLETGIQQAYTSAGAAEAGALTRSARAAGVPVVIRFDMRNPTAEAWLRRHSSTRVTAIVNDQREAIRVALEAGMGRGVNPRTTALDIVGRINRATQRREGGIVGLTSQQSRYVENARSELLSGDPTLLRNYLTRERRDKRFDRAVIRAINSGEPVPADVGGRAAARYSDQLLRLRGETIGRHEALESLHAGQYRALQQAVESGQVREQQVKRRWNDSGDSRVRDDHRAMDGQTVGLNEPFVFPDGSRAMFPGDGSLGAPGAQIIQCRCWVVERVDWLAGVT